MYIVQDTSVAPHRGSFCEVCQFNLKSTLVAVKKTMNVNDTRKFVQEAQLMHSIQHPNCVRLYGVCEAPVSAMVMEWMGGSDLPARPLVRLRVTGCLCALQS